jgi:hypothetical protein
MNIQETSEGPRQAQRDTQVRMQYTYARDLKVHSWAIVWQDQKSQMSEYTDKFI